MPLPNTKRPRLPELIQFRAESGWLAAIETAAERQDLGCAEYLRRCVRRALSREGVKLPSPGRGGPMSAAASKRHAG